MPIDKKNKEFPIKNKQRSNTFGLVINPKLDDQEVDWGNLSGDEIVSKLKELKFPSKFDLTKILNSLEFRNIRGNSTRLEEFDGQLELGDKTKIPHYQIAIKTKTLCLKRPILEALTNSLNAFININIQFNYSEMKKYCEKDMVFISEEYSGKITKHQWNLNFIDRKPELKMVLDSPYPLQKFFLEEILSGKPEGRIIDWLIDPVGNTGKSSFARAYVSQKGTDGILVKIDNLDRMELALIHKISDYRERYDKDPRVIFFDFPRATDFKKVIAATALMEDAKSVHLETCFGGKHREIQIGNVHIVVMSNTSPDLSVLSEDRWRLCRFGSQNVIWPCKCLPRIVFRDETTRMLEWTVEIKTFERRELEEKTQFKGLNLESGPEGSYQTTKSIACCYHEAPNDIKLELLSLKKGSVKKGPEADDDILIYDGPFLPAVSVVSPAVSAEQVDEIEERVSKGFKQVLSRSTKKKK